MADLIAPQTTETPVAAAVPAQAAPAPEGALDKGIKKVARFFAKILGQPDPITGEKNAVVAGGVADKIWNAANTVVAKAETVVTKTTDVATAAVEKAGAVTGDLVQKGTEAVNQVKEEVAAVKPTVAEAPVAPTSIPVAEAQTQPLETLETPKAA